MPYHSAKNEAATEDLIDLLGCSQGSDDTKLMEEDSTLLDEFYDDSPHIKEISQRPTPNQALQQFSDLEYEDSSYRFHFADKGKDDDSIPGLPEKSNDSSAESLFSASGPTSTATSFTSMSNGTTLLDDFPSKMFHEGFAQLKAFEYEDGRSRNSPMAIVDKLTDKVPRLSTDARSDPSEPTSEARAKARDAQVSIGGITTKPCWNSVTIFDSAQDRENAIRINQRSATCGARAISYPDFFKYGIRYVPPSHQRGIYRTVAISGLSPIVTMKTLLEKVRGGMVVDAKLLDTAKITGSNTALVNFLFECSAKAYEDHARQHPINFGNTVARIAVVPTATWPILLSLRSGIENLGHTRCLEVHNVPHDVSLAAVRQELTSSPVMKSNSLECFRLGADRVLEIRFKSIRAAVLSSSWFRRTLHYQGCTVKYAPDPCALPLATLFEQRTEVSDAIKEDISEAESRRGRGFEEHVNIRYNTSPSNGTIEEPLCQETAASMASFAESFFLSK